MIRPCLFVCFFCVVGGEITEKSQGIRNAGEGVIISIEEPMGALLEQRFKGDGVRLCLLRKGICRQRGQPVRRLWGGKISALIWELPQQERVQSVTWVTCQGTDHAEPCRHWKDFGF